MLDNDLAEYAVGCNIITWGGARIASLPVAWTLVAVDVVDAKAKVGRGRERGREVGR